MVRILGLLILLMGFAAPAVAEPPIPTLTGRVIDQAGILDASTVATISERLAGLESSTGIQLVVVTLPDLKGYVIEDWGLALGRSWGIGQAGKNNGLLLIVAPNDRELRIEVGYGLEGEIPDATANSIIQREIIPYFKQGDLNGGVRAGVEAILAALGGSYVATQPLQTSSESSSSGFEEVLPPFLFFALFFGVTVLASLRRRYDPKRRRNAWFVDTSRWGSSSSGSRSSGGSFSGGGGSFGGGGASGRW
jgi:uncharacterized protein